MAAAVRHGPDPGMFGVVEKMHHDHAAGAAARVISHKAHGSPSPPPSPSPTGGRPGVSVTSRAVSLGDRLDLYRAERDTLDSLREKDKEEEQHKEVDVEEVLAQVVRDFQRVLVAARVNLAEIFTQFDHDGDGTVTIKEFRTGLRSLKVQVPEDMVEQLVAAMDRDGDGEIDYREFTKQFAEKGGQFSQNKTGDQVNENPRYLSADELGDTIRGFQQFSHVRNQGTIQLLYRWSLNVDVLHGLSREERLDLVDNVEVLNVKAGEEIVHKGSVGTATTFFIVLSGTCSIRLPPLDSNAFVASTRQETKLVDTSSRPQDRAKESAKRWIERSHEVHAQSVKIAALDRQERQQDATDLAERFGTGWIQTTAGSVEKQRRQAELNGKVDYRKKDDGSPEVFEAQKNKGPKKVYVPGKGYIYVGKHTITAREKRAAVDAKVTGLVKGSLEAHRKQQSDHAGDNRALDELTLASKASRIVGELELAQNHVEMRFAPLSSFGEQRAFHNADQSKVLELGAQTVQLTVRATEEADVKLLAVYRHEDIEAIVAAYRASKQDKIRLLRGMPQYKHMSTDELDKLASFMRRMWASEGETIVSEGDRADAVYFVVSGQLQVTRKKKDGTKKVVNVLGAGASFGQMGVVLDKGTRTASCSALTNCEMLVIHKYNFMRCSDPAQIDSIRSKAAEIGQLNVEKGDEITAYTNSLSLTNFSTGRSIGIIVDETESSKVEGVAGFHAIKLSDIKKGTSIDPAVNTNPLLSKAVPRGQDFAPLPKTPEQAAERGTTPAFAVDETPGLDTSNTAEDGHQAAGEHSGGHLDEGEGKGIDRGESEGDGTARTTPQGDRDRNIRRTTSTGSRSGQGHGLVLRRPKTAGADPEAAQRGARDSSRSASASASGRGSSSARTSRDTGRGGRPKTSPSVAGRGQRQRRQQLRSPGLTVVTTGWEFERREGGRGGGGGGGGGEPSPSPGAWSGPWSARQASPSSSPSPSSGGAGSRPVSASVTACVGMAASPEGAILLHRLSGFAARRLMVSSRQLGRPNSTKPHGAVRPHTTRGGSGSGPPTANRARPEPPGVFPWNVSPHSPRGKMIVHASRLPRAKHVGRA